MPQPGTLSEVLGPIGQSVTNDCTGGRCDSAGYRIIHGVQLCCVASLLLSTMVIVPRHAAFGEIRVISSPSEGFCLQRLKANVSSEDTRGEFPVPVHRCPCCPVFREKGMPCTSDGENIKVV